MHCDVVNRLLKKGHAGHICFTLLLWFNLRNGPPCMNVKFVWISEESDGVVGALTKFMTNILWIHFLLICFHGKLAELTLIFLLKFFLFWILLLTQLEFNDFRIQSHQIWHDICTFMHDQKNPSIELWEKNSQCSISSVEFKKEKHIKFGVKSILWN